MVKIKTFMVELHTYYKYCYPIKKKIEIVTFPWFFCDKEVKHIFFLILSCGDLKKINITAFLAQNLKSAFLEEI